MRKMNDRFSCCQRNCSPLQNFSAKFRSETQLHLKKGSSSMPVLDAFILKGALAAGAERAPLGELTDILLCSAAPILATRSRGSIAWFFLDWPTCG
jgi:hypothetical protein